MLVCNGVCSIYSNNSAPNTMFEANRILDGDHSGSLPLPQPKSYMTSESKFSVFNYSFGKKFIHKEKPPPSSQQI